MSEEIYVAGKCLTCGTNLPAENSLCKCSGFSESISQKLIDAAEEYAQAILDRTNSKWLEKKESFKQLAQEVEDRINELSKYELLTPNFDLQSYPGRIENRVSYFDKRESLWRELDKLQQSILDRQLVTSGKVSKIQELRKQLGLMEES